MPLPVPSLDDRTFDQLVAEGRALIPRYTNRWTDHNVSDPGITLLELFAWLTETAIFEVDQVPDAAVRKWLRLLGRCSAPDEPVAEELARAVRDLQRPTRAITSDDVLQLAGDVADEMGTPVARAEYLAGDDPICSWPQPVGVLVVVPREPRVREDSAVLRALCDALHRAIAPATLITTRLHVTGPEWVDTAMRIVVVRRPASGLTAEAVKDAVARFLDPVTGWVDETGWPFGRPIHRSELFQLLERLPGVDHVVDVELPAETITRDTQLPRGGHAKVEVEVRDG